MELLWGHQTALRRHYAAPFGGLWNSFEIPKKLYGLSIFGPLHGTPVLFKSSYLSSFWFKYYYYSALQLSISLQSRHLFFFFFACYNYSVFVFALKQGRREPLNSLSVAMLPYAIFYYFWNCSLAPIYSVKFMLLHFL